MNDADSKKLAELKERIAKPSHDVLVANPDVEWLISKIEQLEKENTEYKRRLGLLPRIFPVIPKGEVEYEVR